MQHNYLQRSKIWIDEQAPDHQAIGDAYLKMHAKYETLKATLDDKGLQDAEACLEHLLTTYDAKGGEVEKLLTATEAADTTAPVVDYIYDSSPLYPVVDEPVVSVLTQEQKQAKIEELKKILRSG